jgi:hypothetical protein
MLSVVYYREVKDGDVLATTAVALRKLYEANGAKVLTNKLIPATKEQPAEHLIAVLFVPDPIKGLQTVLGKSENYSTTILFTAAGCRD